MENDLAAIILKLGDGWDADAIKELSEILSGICEDFAAAKLKVTLELVKKPPLIEMPKKGLVVVDSNGRLKMKEATHEVVKDAELGDLL